MKSLVMSIAAIAMSMMLCVLAPSRATAQHVDVSFQLFYDELSPYGQWVDHPNYGYVWLPDAGNNFEPYSTDGHWIYTNYGWTWVSYYPWGWAPFHYGRWGYDSYYGWFWVPGNEWGPSWVSWRQADGYFGWQPLGPGISISLSFGSGYNRNRDHWMFVRSADIERDHINKYYVPRSERDRIITRSSIIKETYNDNDRHTTYITGPSRNDFKRYTGRDIRPAAVREYSKPGQEVRQGEIHLYRPNVRENVANEPRPRPARVIKSTEVKRSSEQNVPRDVSPTNQDRRKEQQQNVSKPQPAARPTRTPDIVQPDRKQDRRNEQPQNISKPYDTRTSKPQPAARPTRTPDVVQPDRVPKSAPEKEKRRPTQTTNPDLPVNQQRTPQERVVQPEPKSTARPMQQQPQQPKRDVRTKEDRKKLQQEKATNKRNEPKKESDADKKEKRRE